MTLVAAWKEGDIPLLIGDLVVSSKGDLGSSHHPLPTRDDLDRILPRGSAPRISEPVQKVYRVSRSLVIGFSGSNSSAQDIVNATLFRFGDEDPSIDDVRDHFRGITDHKSPDCTIIGWVGRPGSFQCFCWWSAEPLQFQTGISYVIGSGAKYFNRVFALRSIVLGHEPLEAALAMIGDLMKDEVLYGINLRHLFGGGFKIIYYEGDQFVVLPSVTYIFLQIEETEQVGTLALRQPDRLLKIHQNNQMMETMVVLVDEASISTSQSEVPELASHRMYYTPPLTAEPGDTYTVNDNLSFESDYYCICIDVKLKDKLPIAGDDKILVISIARVVSNERKNSILEVSQHPDETEGLILKDGLFKEVFRALESLDRGRLVHWAMRSLGSGSQSF